MRRLVKSSLLFFVASYFLSSAFASQPGLLDIHRPRDHQLRALLGPDPQSSSSSSAGQTTAEHTTAAPSTSAAQSPTQQSTSAQTTPTTSSTTSSAAPTTNAPATTSSASKTLVGTTATNSDGQIITSFVTVSAPTASSTTPSAPPDSSSDSGIGSGTIIGLSVAGGVALIAIISFFIWKFTRKRFSDFDDNEAIKWPELNSHGGDIHALPTNSTGRAGFGAENESDLNLARAPSPGGGNYAQSVGTSSIGAGHDPYAVPPLPHLNPSQPYRDDPGAYGESGYYDPYRGPIPNTLGDGMSDHGGEAIPMTQMTRTRSPGPQLAYDMQGRASPGPQAGFGYGGIDDRARSPNPAAAGGTRSPAPHVPYGYRQ